MGRKIATDAVRRRLGQARGEIDFALAHGGFQLREILKVAPAQFDIEGFGQ
jgi:hypothetical protein